MIKLPIKIPFEQAVYGSFPFWRRGYAVLAHSAGCRPEWLAELRRACQRYGELPPGLVAATGLFVQRLKSGPWLIASVHPHGRDDHDRPGALSFHAIFVHAMAYRLFGADPFALAGALHHDWTVADIDRTLPALTWRAVRDLAARDGADMPGPDSRQAQIVQALAQGRRAIVQATEPITPLARSVWRALPRSVRQRATLATWAFDNTNKWDLVGLPKLARVELDASDLVFALERINPT